MATSQLARRLERLLLLYRSIAVLAALAFFGWLVVMYIGPQGKKVIRYDISPADPPAILGAFAQKESARIIGIRGPSAARDYFQELTIDPVYFSVPALRSWQKATVRILYENPNSQPIIRLGVMGNVGYSFHVLAHFDEGLENLKPYWVQRREGDVVLWQKNAKAYEVYEKRRRELEEAAEVYREDLERYQERLTRLPRPDTLVENEEEEAEQPPEPVKVEQELKKLNLGPYLETPLPYASIDDFLMKLPPVNQIARFQYDFADLVHLPGYTPAKKRTVSTVGLRGSHTVIAYVGENENLDFRFGLRDYNRHADDDQLKVKVTRGSRVAHESVFTDDGVSRADDSVSEPREFQLLLPTPGEGVYRIELKTTDDLFFTSIDTQQHRWYFDGHVYITDNEEYRKVYPEKTFSPTRIISFGSSVRVRTAHVSSLQTIRVGTIPLPLEELHTLHEVDSLGFTTTVTIPKNDVFIEGGSFALSSRQYFSIKSLAPPNLDELRKPLDDYDFIIAYYPARVTKNNLLEASAEAPGSKLVKRNGRYEFILNVPGLFENHRRLRLYELEVTLEGEPITLRKIVTRLRTLLKL